MIGALVLWNLELNTGYATLQKENKTKSKTYSTTQVGKFCKE